MRFHTLLTACFFVLAIVSCDTSRERKRAYGYFRLGNVENFRPNTTTFLHDLGLFVRHDEKGYSVMSTLCTYDLSSLEYNGKEFSSQITESRYDSYGHVLHGPATAHLPYFEAVLEAGEYGGGKDTLYAKVGRQVPESDRLAAMPTGP